MEHTFLSMPHKYRLLLFSNTHFNVILVYGWFQKILNKKFKNICQNEFIHKSDLFRQNLITQCIWFKVKIYLLKHCVLNVFSEIEIYMNIWNIYTYIWNWQIIFTFNLNYFNFINNIIAFCAYLNSHLSKLWWRRMNIGVGELWKSHPIGPEGWLGEGRGGGSNSSKITSHNLQAASYLPSSLCRQFRSLNNQTSVYYVDRLWRLWL